MLFEALHKAIALILAADAEVVQYASRSLFIAMIATSSASLLGIPIGAWIAEHEFRGKRLIVTILNTLLGIPTVVVGLFVYSFISSKGPFGALGLLFTVPGIIVGEVFLILPLIVAFTFAAVARVDRDVRLCALSLGADRRQALWAVFRESRFGILAAVIAGYGRVVGEVGIATIIGGNADGFTRTLTTSIVLNIEMGYFERALALGMVLLMLSFLINVAFQFVQGRGQRA